jgi:hypothetical protein
LPRISRMSTNQIRIRVFSREFAANYFDLRLSAQICGKEL